MKKILTSLLVVLLALALVGCSKADDSVAADANTTEGKLAEILKEELKNSDDLLTVVNNMLDKQDAVPYMLMAMECEEGWLNGFDGDVTGFSKAVVFSPAIAQPFIGYVFETDNKEDLKKALDAQANLRWNICTEADYKAIVDLDDTHIFFLMTPNNFDE